MTSSRWPADRLDPEAYIGPGHDLPVFYGDLDTLGHLNNVAFGRFFEQSRFETHRRVGIPKLMAENQARFLVARVSIDYLGEAHFGSPLHVRIKVSEIRNASVIEQQAAWQKGVCVALSEVVTVYVTDAGPTRVSEHVRTALAGLLPTP